MPFSSLSGTRPARIRLEQVEPKKFVLLRGFRYVRPSTGQAFEVTPAGLGPTDLTTIPFPFRWFVNAYGRHTLPALLHDLLVREEDAKAATVSGVAPKRAEADDIFLEALGEEGVPVLRRHLMWAAVTFTTRFCHGSGVAQGFMRLWLACAVAGTSLVFAPWWCSWLDGPPRVCGVPLLSIVGILAPSLGALLWGRKYWAGWWFSNGLVVLGPPSLVILPIFAVYYGAEFFFHKAFGTPRPPSITNF
jgi:Protein of unknown function (DUF1353)